MNKTRLPFPGPFFIWLHNWFHKPKCEKIPEPTRLKCVDGRWFAQVLLPTDPDRIPPGPDAWYCIGPCHWQYPEVVSHATVNDFCQRTKKQAAGILREYCKYRSERINRAIAEELLK